MNAETEAYYREKLTPKLKGTLKRISTVRSNELTPLDAIICDEEEREYAWYIASGGGGEPYLFLEGGPTGYESAPLGSLMYDVSTSDKKEWLACFGTPGRYDRLTIYSSSLLELRDYLHWRVFS